MNEVLNNIYQDKTRLSCIPEYESNEIKAKVFVEMYRKYFTPCNSLVNRKFYYTWQKKFLIYERGQLIDKAQDLLVNNTKTLNQNIASLIGFLDEEYQRVQIAYDAASDLLSSNNSQLHTYGEQIRNADINNYQKRFSAITNSIAKSIEFLANSSSIGMNVLEMIKLFS